MRGGLLIFFILSILVSITFSSADSINSSEWELHDSECSDVMSQIFIVKENTFKEGNKIYVEIGRGSKNLSLVGFDFSSNLGFITMEYDIPQLNERKNFVLDVKGSKITSLYITPVVEVNGEERLCWNYSKIDFEDDVCTDSDGGINFFVKGYTYGGLYGFVDNYTIDEFYDFCIQLDENGDYPWLHTSYESYIENRSWNSYEVEKCETNCGIYEFSCKDNMEHVYTDLFKCLNGCEDGACIQSSKENQTIINQESILFETLCEKGCAINGECVDYGKINETIYCDKNGKIFQIREPKDSCFENYECSLGECIDGACKNHGFFKRILLWIEGLFGED